MLDSKLMRFHRPDGGIVELARDAGQAMIRHRQNDEGSAEAGGVLLGRLILETTDVVIDIATEPTSEDRRTRFSFFRSERTAQEKIRTAWSESGGTRIYLGEWHTHPEDDPHPSIVDRLDWIRIRCVARVECDCLFFFIVGRSRVSGWELRKAWRRPRFLEPQAP